MNSKFIQVTNEGVEINGVVLTSAYEIKAYISAIYKTADIGVKVGGVIPKDILIQFWVSKTATKDLNASLFGMFTGTKDLDVELSGWRYKDLFTRLGGNLPKDLQIFLHAWQTTVLTTNIAGHAPANLPVTIDGDPHFGITLEADFGITCIKNLNVLFSVWTRIKDLNVIIKPYHVKDLITYIGTSGGFKDLYIDLPMKTGYKDFYVLFKPNVKKLSALIKVHLMQHKDLYVSINKGFPCNFGSSYRDFNVSMFINPEYLLRVYFYGCLGSGQKDLRIHINQEFNWYMNYKLLSITVPGLKDTFVNFKRCIYKNDFSNIYLNKKTISFMHPRRHVNGGRMNLNVNWVGLKDNVRDFFVQFKARYQLPPVLQSSGEIELWGQDPPEVVRLVEIMFEQQVHEYIWSSVEQKAYSRAVWEKWVLMSRSYPKEVLYGGQLDFVSVKTLFNLTKYQTMDEAIRYLIDQPILTDYRNLDVNLEINSGSKKLEIYFYIISNLKDLKIIIQPVREFDLEVTFEAI